MKPKRKLTHAMPTAWALHCPFCAAPLDKARGQQQFACGSSPRYGSSCWHRSDECWRMAGELPVPERERCLYCDGRRRVMGRMYCRNCLMLRRNGTGPSDLVGTPAFPRCGQTRIPVNKCD